MQRTVLDRIKLALLPCRRRLLLPSSTQYSCQIVPAVNHQDMELNHLDEAHHVPEKSIKHRGGAGHLYIQTYRSAHCHCWNMTLGVPCQRKCSLCRLRLNSLLPLV